MRASSFTACLIPTWMMRGLRSAIPTMMAIVAVIAADRADATAGQASTATLRGVVVDHTGAAIPDAAITATHGGTGLQRHATGSAEGLFVIPLLPPGEYVIAAQHDGFSPAEVRGLVLNVGDELNLTIRLDVAGVGEAVTIAAEPSRISTSPAVGTVVNRALIDNLPLNGRSFQSLILLTPGVTVVPDGSFNTGQFSVNGQRADANYFTVDGVSANIGIGSAGTASGSTAPNAMSGATPGLTAFGGTNNLVSVDALEEFRIQTSSYSAAFGRQPGGQISLVTRSGTSQFHGTLYDYLRNDAFDARDWFNARPAPKPALRQNQFGGTLGGPIPLPGASRANDRAFFFVSYEGLRMRLPRSGVAQVPSPRLRDVAAPSLQYVLNAFPRPTGTETTVTCNPASDATCGANGTKPSGFAPYTYAFSDPSTLDATSVRVDYTPSSRLTLFGRYNDAPSNDTTHASWMTTPQRNSAVTQTMTIGATSALSPTLSHELRVNYSRQHGETVWVNEPIGGAAPIDLATVTSGYTSGVSTVVLNMSGQTASLYLGRYNDSWQHQINVVDQLSWVKGRHQFKFGLDYRRLAPTYSPRDSYHFFNISNEADIRAGRSTLSTISTTGTARPRFDNISTYAHDSWTLSSRLTIDLGLRWEINPPPSEADDKLPAMVVGMNGNDISHAALAPPGTLPYETMYAAFAPRMGLAYQVRQQPGWETVVRGGAGKYYDLGSGATIRGYTNGVPFFAQRILSGASFPLSDSNAVPPPLPEIALPVTAPVYATDPTLTLPYTWHWNVAVEQALGRRQSVSVSYVGSAARDLLITETLNQPSPTGVRPNPQFGGFIYRISNATTADYHALQAQYRGRWAQGTQALVSYTWGHAIDEISNDYSGVQRERGNASFDVRHNLSAALTWALPSMRAGGLRPLLRDWSIDAIVHAQSGLPVDIFGFGGTVILEDGRALNARPDVVPGEPYYLDDPSVPGGRRFNAAAFRAPQPNPATPNVPVQGNFGRNVLRGLPISQTDLALGRTFAIARGLRAQIKAQAFNVFNHPMFGSYGLQPGVPSTFGVPSATLNRGLGGLSALYQLGGPRSMQFSLRLLF